MTNKKRTMIEQNKKERVVIDLQLLRFYSLERSLNVQWALVGASSDSGLALLQLSPIPTASNVGTHYLFRYSGCRASHTSCVDSTHCSCILFLWSHSWCSALVLAHLCLHAALQHLVFHPDKRGEGGSWLGLTCPLRLGRGTYAADTLGMCRECLHRKRPRRRCYSLGQGLHSPGESTPGHRSLGDARRHRLPGRSGQWLVPTLSLVEVGQLSCPPPGSELQLTPPLELL